MGKKNILISTVAIIIVAFFISMAASTALDNEKINISGAIVNTKRISTISLSLSSSSVEVQQNMHADVLLKYKSGISYARVNVKVITPDGSVVSPSEGSTFTTDSNGRFSFDYVPTIAGTYAFKASYSGSLWYSPSSATVSFTATAIEKEPEVVDNEGSVETTTQPVRWTWLQASADAVINQSSTYSIKFEVKATDGIWYGASNTGINFTFTAPNGEKDVISVTTSPNGAGVGTVQFIPDVVGSWKVVCDWDHNNKVFSWESSSAKDINVVSSYTPAPAKQNTVLTISGPATVQLGTSQTISATLKSTDGATMNGAKIQVQVTNPSGSTSAIQTVTTGSNGVASYTITPSVAGTYIISMTYGGDDTHLGTSGSISFSAIAPTPVVSKTYDYIVSNSGVKNAAGSTVYSGSTFTAALAWSVAQPGKITYVPAGTYAITKNLAPATGSTLMGDGPSSTIFDFTGGSGSDAIVINWNGNAGTKDVTLKGFKITGNGWITMGVVDGSTVGNYTFIDITIENTPSYHPYAIGTWVQSKSVIDGISMTRVVINRANTYGISFQGEGIYDFSTRNSGNWVKNIVLDSCVVSYCGVNGRVNDWVTGYDFELVNIDTVTITNCEAYYNWESGFHFECWGQCLNANLYNCVSSYNGNKPLTYQNDDGWVGPRYAYGYCIASEFTDAHLHNCTGTGNYNGLTEPRYTG